LRSKSSSCKSGCEALIFSSYLNVMGQGALDSNWHWAGGIKRACKALGSIDMGETNTWCLCLYGLKVILTQIEGGGGCYLGSLRVPFVAILLRTFSR
jgi:hypothetical protein